MEVKPSTDREYYDVVIKVLEQACNRVGEAIGASAGSAFPDYGPRPDSISGQKSRPFGVKKIYDGLYNLLQQARKERSELKD